MPAEINIEDLTNTLENGTDTGVFDVLMNSVNKHIDTQYKQSRISGTDYATVYLGSLQSVLSQSLTFILEKQKAEQEISLIEEKVNSEKKSNSAGGIIDKQLLKLKEEIELLKAQTAGKFQDIELSKKEDLRKSVINNAQVSKLKSETDLVKSEIVFSGSKNSEVLAGTLRSNAESGEKVRLMIEQVSKTTAETNLTNSQITLTNSRNLETLAATTRADAESTERVKLITAQATGFKTDAKQKLMRQLYEGYGINTNISGEVTQAPAGSTGIALDNIANDILNDLGSTVNV